MSGLSDMAGKFQFELISPEKIIFSGAVEEVNIPGSEGFFSAMAGHMPLITRVLPGPVRIYKGVGAGEELRFVIFGGFVEVTPARTSLMVEAVVPLQKLDKQDINRRIEHARALLKDVRTEESRSRLEEFIYHMSTINSAHG